MQPDDAGLEMARIKSIQDNAKRLGLTWMLRLATVQDGENTVDAASIVYDGDTEAIQAVSMVGRLTGGARVYVIGSPEAANHIVGSAASGAAPYRDRIVTTAVTASVTFTNIPSNLRSVTVRSATRINASGAANLYARINQSSDGAAYFTHLYGANGTGYITPEVQTGVGAMNAGVCCGNNNANEYGAGELILTNWSRSAGHLAGLFSGSAIVGSSMFSRTGGVAFATAGPYSTITLLPSSNSFEVGCTFDLIGDQV